MKFQPGGTRGGELAFLAGAGLSLLGLWLFFDSVHFTSGHPGLLSTALHGGRPGGGGGPSWGQTTSMGVLLVPLFVGVAALFFDARRTWAWVLTWIGAAILLIEIVSRMRPEFHVKASHAILMLVLIAGGLGLMLRAYAEDRRRSGREAGGDPGSNPPGEG